MITVNSMKCIVGKDRWDFQFKGLSTDPKPQDSWLGNRLAINSMFLEQDTGDFYYLKSMATPSTWATLIEQSFTGEHEGDERYSYTFDDTIQFSDVITVILDGEEYTVEKQGENDEYYYGGYDPDQGNYDFSVYPFCVVNWLEDGAWDVAIAVTDGDEHTVQILGETSGTPAVWKKFGSGGGEPEPTGTKLFEGDVTVQYDDDDDLYYYQNDEVMLNYSSLIVEVNGTRYTLSNTGSDGDFVFADGDGDIWEGTATFELESDNNNDRFYFYTKEDGTYSLKIWADSDPVEGDPVE